MAENKTKEEIPVQLTRLMDYVVPSSSVLIKHCNRGWEYYKSDGDFVKEIGYMSESTNEDFHGFINRAVQQLMKDEENDDERLVATDYAIWRTKKEEPITVRKFMLNKFPTNKYMDCPIPKHHWETIQEYAQQYASQQTARYREANRIMKEELEILYKQNRMAMKEQRRLLTSPPNPYPNKPIKRKE